MKIVHLSTCVFGSSAFLRLHRALQLEGIDSIILSQYIVGTFPGVYKVKSSIERKIEDKIYGCKWKDELENYQLLENMPFSVSLIGENVTRQKAVTEADIIHMHWICGFLSPKTIKKLYKLKKPIVWTCHDSWPFTGGCHVRYGCDKFQSKCEKCPILQSEEENDLAAKIFEIKKVCFEDVKLNFIAPSNWMKKNIETSTLFRQCRCERIPNPLNIETYTDMDLEVINAKLNYQKDKTKIHVLFGSVSIKIPYKGFSYLEEMLKILYDRYTSISNKVVLHFVGYDRSNAEILKKYECKYWDYVQESEIMACIYNVADVFVFPTLEDNLPGMIMESLSCGTPVVAFRTGGVEDIVDHKNNGYIAEYKNSVDLLKGFLWTINNNEDNFLGKNGQKKIRKKFNPELIAQKHMQFYELLLNGE